MADTNLYHATTNLHHDAEKHPFGERMLNGTLSRQEWTDWLGAMEQIHIALDPYLPPSLKRAHDLHMDLLMMLPLKPARSEAIEALTLDLIDPELIGGLSYVLSGANLRGGQVIRKRLSPLGFPCNHLSFDAMHVAPADNWLKRLRDAKALRDGAQQAFRAVLCVMDEINERALAEAA